MCTKKLLDKCERSNKIAPFQHARLASLGPFCIYPAIPYCAIFFIFSPPWIILDIDFTLDIEGDNQSLNAFLGGKGWLKGFLKSFQDRNIL